MKRRQQTPIPSVVLCPMEQDLLPYLRLLVPGCLRKLLVLMLYKKKKKQSWSKKESVAACHLMSLQENLPQMVVAAVVLVVAVIVQGVRRRRLPPLRLRVVHLVLPTRISFLPPPLMVPCRDKVRKSVTLHSLSLVENKSPMLSNNQKLSKRMRSKRSILRLMIRRMMILIVQQKYPLLLMNNPYVITNLHIMTSHSLGLLTARRGASRSTSANVRQKNVKSSKKQRKRNLIPSLVQMPYFQY